MALSSDSDSISWDSSNSESFELNGPKKGNLVQKLPGSPTVQKRDAQKWRDLEEKFKHVPSRVRESSPHLNENMHAPMKRRERSADSVDY